MIIRPTFFLTIFLAVIMTQPTDAQSTYHVYFLAGQSNMDGLGAINELPPELNRQFPDVPIFHGSTAADGDSSGGQGIWAPLRPGHGWGFWSDGGTNHYSPLFGVELSFARRLQELHPERKIALVKYSRAGTSIDPAAADVFGCWHPEFEGINQFTHWQTTVKNALAAGDIDGNGQPDRLVPAGIVWMQGESDAIYSAAIAERYFDNLNAVMAAMRREMGAPELPVVIGRISDSGQDADGKYWDYAAEVRRGQQRFVESDPAAALITATDNYTYVDDGAHYDTPSLIDLGQRFAEGLSKY